MKRVREYTTSAGVVDAEIALHHLGGTADLVGGQAALPQGFEFLVETVLNRIGGWFIRWT